MTHRTQEPPLRFLLPCFAEHGSTVEGATGAFVSMKPFTSLMEDLPNWEMSLWETINNAPKFTTFGRECPYVGKCMTMVSRLPRTREQVVADFWMRVKTASKHDCWEWQRTKKKGWQYGIMVLKGKRIRTHRFSASFRYGEVPGNLHVCHTCDNPPCCNPYHLFIGTNLENTKDMISKGRDRHLLGEERPQTKLTRDQVIQIKKMKASSEKGWRQRLADEFGVSPLTVRNIALGLRWKHIKISDL